MQNSGCEPFGVVLHKRSKENQFEPEATGSSCQRPWKGEGGKPAEMLESWSMANQIEESNVQT